MCAQCEQYFPRQPAAVRVEAHCDATQPGELLGLVGGPPEIGAWDAGKAVLMRTCAEVFPLWVVDIGPLPSEAEFKFVIMRAEGEVFWEPLPRGGNRHWPAVARSGAKVSTTFGEYDLYVAESVVLAEGGGGGRRPRFKPTVSCWQVRDLCELDIESRSVLWWQQEDFAEFLRVRVEIGRAFVEAKRNKKVTKHGSFDLGPSLANESRRGLGLQRMDARKHALRAYIDAVLNEQARQRRDSPAGAAFVWDFERSAEVARAVSESDAAWAIDRAVRDRERVLQDSAEGRHCPAELQSLQVDGQFNPPGIQQTGRILEPEQTLQVDDGSPVPSMHRVPSFPLCCGTSVDSHQSMISPLQSSKGFGLSRDELEQAGLRANGQLVRSLEALPEAMKEDHDSGDERVGALGDTPRGLGV